MTCRAPSVPRQRAYRSSRPPELFSSADRDEIRCARIVDAGSLAELGDLVNDSLLRIRFLSASASLRSVCTVVRSPFSMREIAELAASMRFASSAWLSSSWPRRRMTIRANASYGASL